MLDFYRLAAAVPGIEVADPDGNTDRILEKLKEIEPYHPAVTVFPELSLTGYSCQDLFFQNTLQNSVRRNLIRILKETRDFPGIVIVGAPLYLAEAVYNAAYVMAGGELLGIPVKTYLPNYHEFYEKRWFQSAENLTRTTIPVRELGLDNLTDPSREIPVGNRILFTAPDRFSFGVELCEDLWAPEPPSTILALGGAEILLNLSASNETIAKRTYRRDLVRHQSAALLTDYLYVSAGSSESTQDLIYSGQSILAENGSVLNESRDFIADDYVMMTDVDLGKIRCDRQHSSTFADNCLYRKKELAGLGRVIVPTDLIPESDGAYISVRKKPFIPANGDARRRRCTEIFDMQVGGLVKRLSVTHAKPVIGVSGGMDSTLALLAAARALKKMNRPSTDLIAITMPAFGTSDRTYQNSLRLIQSLGTKPVVISIKDACLQHLKDLGHPEDVRDITYENTQARERTQVLMDYANAHGGLVVGTGDLSELALGWCTYNADQMSMYGVNGSIPKTLVRWMIEAVAETGVFPESHDVLMDILDTPISPELLPPDEEGKITQKTEDVVGPYVLHDFFLYYHFRYGYGPEKIYFLAKKAFRKDYQEKEILHWMKKYFQRFFSQQFKRSCMPDTVKVGSISLSPRGDWRMPSDASSQIWLKEIQKLEEETD